VARRRAKDYQQDKSDKRDQKSQRPRLTTAQIKQDIQQANQQEGNPGILVIAVVVVTAFIAFYYHILALQGMEQLTGGMSMLDHRLAGFNVADVERLAERMDDEAMQQYNWIHITAGRIFPVMMALSIIVVGFWTLRSKLAKWSAVIVAVGYAALEIWASSTRETALLDPSEANVTLASSLTIAQWLLLALLVVGLAVMLILKFIGRNSPGLETSLDPEREIP
jgi:hypothetical protein